MAKSDRWVLVAAVVASGVLSLALGQDINFDQRHYHFYLGWSLLRGRIDLDVAPVPGGTYLNPALHVPTYLGIRYLPPRVFGALLGAVHGLNLYLVYLIALHVLPANRRSRVVAVLAAVAAGTGPLAVSLVGTTFGDNLVSIPMLASVLVLVAAVEKAERERADDGPKLSLGLLAWSAALAGAAAGLKLTFALFYIPLALVVLGLAVWARSWGAVVVFAGTSALGFGLTAGYWAFEMWRHFSNPLFPFANSLFHSPYYAAMAVRDVRWASHGWADALLEAVYMALGRTEQLQEMGFSDARYLFFLWLAALALAHRVLGFRTSPMPVVARVVLLYWMGCYVAWLVGTHYYRYFAIGEYLAPAALLALLGCLFRRGLPGAWLAVVVAVVITSQSWSWGRTAWGGDWYRVRFASPPEPGAAVMVDGGMCSFVLPYFPEGTRFFGVVGGLYSPLHALVAHSIRAHRGPIYRLRADEYPSSRLESFGLADTGDCAPIRTRAVWLTLCRLERTPGPP